MTELCVVGIGPGDIENMSIAAYKALAESQVILGYQLYTELVKAHFPGKEYISTPMTKEAERCRRALELAEGGKKTCLICSGDSGIYGMAALVYQLRGERREPAIKLIPGLTAASSGAALLGAPLTHDFAVISLSDRLTPWEKIEERLALAARADLSIVLYNPASRGRPEHLRRACDVLLRYLPPERICGIARNIGREGESRQILSLGELREAQADMFCTVFIGNQASRMIAGEMVTPRGYKDV